jgi:1-acyl-sn-glycerol-3-phosphate acyltransferase
VHDLLPIHTRHFFPGKLTLTAGEPIETAGMTLRQTDELTERLRAVIEELRGQPVPEGVESAALMT